MLKKSPAIQSHSGRNTRIGIIGGGPAGLSIARLLKEKGITKIVIFEALPQVGGKSYSVQQGSTIVEMGTCYATFSHKVTNRWMRDYKMEMSGLGDQRFDGADFMDYIKAGSGPMLPVQVLKYRNAKAKLEKAMRSVSPPEWALEQAAMPIRDWLRERILGKIEHFFHRSTTNIAYGFVDEVPTIQALCWNDMELIWSGLLKQLHMPVEGWAEFWNKVASDLDVRLNTPVSKVERTGTHSIVTTESGDTHTFDQLICAIPVDDFSKLTTPTENEAVVNESIVWNGYTTTLFAAENWFKDVHVEAYKNAVIPGAKLGQLLSARNDGHEPDFGGDLYLSGQLSGDYTSEELKELLREDVARKGGHVTNIILQKMWKYHARYKLEAVKQGLIKRLEQMQGERGTWYTGATFSYEAVSHITSFNVKLAQKMQSKILAS